MPLLSISHPFAGASLGIWQIAEEEAFFRNDLPLSPDEEREWVTLKGIRRMEWLVGRWLLHRLTGEPHRLLLAKDAFSKPFFLDQPDLYCSLSHSHGVVGALLADQNCGCDLQVLVEKMPRLAPKFLSKAEMDFVCDHSSSVQFELFHIFWTAKESLYKAYGLKELDFRAHLRVEPFKWDGTSGIAVGMLEKGVFRQQYCLEFKKTDLSVGAGAYICTTCHLIL